MLSPDLAWIAFREYQRSFVTPFEWIGKPVTISAYDGIGFARRIDPSDGASMAWSDASTVSWPRGGTFHEKALDDILAGTDGTRTTDITVRFEVALPRTTIALTNARVVTMDEGRSVLESATILVRGHRIAEVGPHVVVPAEARVFDLAGHTVIPGLVDAHAHSVGQLATTQLIEQRLPGVTGSLAHGVTTLYELYGSEEKEPWVSDMIRSGRMDGPRMLSVGAPMYGIREYRPRTYRPIASYDDADQHARFSRDMGITALKDYVNFTRADRHQLITAARERGLNVLSETAAIPPMNFTQIIDGVTGLEHTMGLTPLYGDVVELFRASGTGVTPTLLVVYNGPVGQAYFDQSQRYWEDEKLLRFSTGRAAPRPLSPGHPLLGRRPVFARDGGRDEAPLRRGRADQRGRPRPDAGARHALGDGAVRPGRVLGDGRPADGDAECGRLPWPWRGPGHDRGRQAGGSGGAGREPARRHPQFAAGRVRGEERGGVQRRGCGTGVSGAGGGAGDVLSAGEVRG